MVSLSNPPAAEGGGGGLQHLFPVPPMPNAILMFLLLPLVLNCKGELVSGPAEGIVQICTFGPLRQNQWKNRQTLQIGFKVDRHL
jgi:hypothetical protein